jgi:pimeloyl-ACP methyl ester carboxylesterase
MEQRPFQVAVGDGVLDGHIGGVGAPALVLHGGPGLPDYMEGCAVELGRLFTTIRYTQRGTAPSTVSGPYTVETHMADALAVLDALGLDKAWAIGHSWGGHLALHLAVAHPEHLHGIVCIDTLGASDDVLPEFEEALLGRLTEEERSRYDEIEERYEEGEATEEELLEQRAIIWPGYFFDPASAPPPLVKTVGVDCYRETFESISEHFEAGTLSKGLRKVRLTALFAHGINDPLPLRGALETAKYLRGAKVGRIPRCGHFPWLEQPGFLDRMIRGLIAQL